VDAQLINGLQAIAIKPESNRGTTISLAALRPASTITTDAVIKIALAVGELICINLLISFALRQTIKSDGY
jgi:hypothetical protein